MILSQWARNSRLMDRNLRDLLSSASTYSVTSGTSNGTDTSGHNSSPNALLYSHLDFTWYQSVVEDSRRLHESLLRAQQQQSAPPPFQSADSTAFVAMEDDGQGRKYKRNNSLAQVCQKWLKRTVYPRSNEIFDMVSEVKASMPAVPDKKLRSLVREWFRKRREYLSTKIYRLCDQFLPKEKGKNDQDIDALIERATTNADLIGLIVLQAKLPMEDEAARREFVKEKIVDYYKQYPSRKHRNLCGISEKRAK